MLKFHVLNVGGEIVRNLVVPDNRRQVFVGDYERLRDAYIAPDPVFDRVWLDRFVGRTWLLDQVDAFLRGNDRGYFILEAEAGLGKTAFLAHLVQSRGDIIHLFAEQVRGQEGVAHGLRSLAAQLIRAWGLQPYAADGVLPGAADRPDFLDRLLREAAQVRNVRRPGEPIVLVVDGLDEAGTPPGQNVLGLPRVLPEGVFLVVSHRPVPVDLNVQGPRDRVRLRAENPDNQGDMRDYLEQAASWPGIASALRGSGYSDEQFVATLLEKCRGVWIYLHYIIEEIAGGKRSPLALDTLPDGLFGYYAEFWRRERDASQDVWDQKLLPLLGTLGAAQEALTASSLVELAGIGPESGRHRRRLGERWRPFLAIEEGTDRRYRLYHASLRDFLEGRVDPEPLSEADRELTAELEASVRRAHGRIADRYLAAWGGLEPGLPGLEEAARCGLDDGYGLRHLGAHLEGAGRAADLHRLLRLERRVSVPAPDPGIEPQARYEPLPEGRAATGPCQPVWFATLDRLGQTGVFLGDVTRAWRLAEGSNDLRPSGSLGFQCRYALVTTSIRTLAGKIPNPLLKALVEKGIWHPAKALVYVRQIQDVMIRAEALAALAPRLEPGQRDAALTEALAAARASGPSGTGPRPWLPSPRVWSRASATRPWPRR